MENVFYFMLKALFVLQIFTFLYGLFGYVEKRLDKKAMVSFKVYDVTDWTANDCNIHILANISRNKGNQAIKFRQLMEYNMRNIFFEKSCTKYGGKGSPRSFYENQN